MIDLACLHDADDRLLVDALCRAVAAEIAAVHGRPVTVTVAGAGVGLAPLVLELVEAGGPGFSARLRWAFPGAAPGAGPVIESATLDAEGIPAGAIRSFAETLVALTPLPLPAEGDARARP